MMRSVRRLQTLALAWIAGLMVCLFASGAHAHTGGLTGLATLIVRGEVLSYAITFNSIPPGPVADRMRIGVAGVEPIMRPLLETLRVYFACGNVAVTAARRLHLSVRAVTYRLDRVTTLTGRDPGDPDDRFVLDAALRCARVLGWPAAPLRS